MSLQPQTGGPCLEHVSGTDTHVPARSATLHWFIGYWQARPASHRRAPMPPQVSPTPAALAGAAASIVKRAANRKVDKRVFMMDSFRCAAQSASPFPRGGFQEFGYANHVPGRGSESRSAPSPFPAQTSSGSLKAGREPGSSSDRRETDPSGFRPDGEPLEFVAGTWSSWREFRLDQPATGRTFG